MDIMLTPIASIGDLIPGVANQIPIAHWGGDGPGWWIVFAPLFWVLIIVAVVLLVRSRRWAPPGGHRRETAIDVLERRFAEGDLSLEQYRERRSVLEEGRERP